MSTLASSTRAFKPTRRIHAPVNPEIKLLVAPICPCEMIPSGRPGLVEIGGKGYALSYLATLPREGEPQVHGFRFVKGDGTTHDVEAGEYGLICDCGDHTFRTRADGMCRHTKCLATLRERGQLS